jgi:DNA-binding NarL/FixJ family response regulator
VKNGRVGFIVLDEVSVDQARLLVVLFPHLEGLEFVRVEGRGDGVVIVARSGSGPVGCRECGTLSGRVHDRYRRRLEDLSCAGLPVRVELEVRRFRCGSPACEVATFAEQIEGVTQWRQRRTPRLRAVLERVALALAGRAGARLTATLGVTVSRCTLLRLIRALPDPEFGQVTVLGVDEFAKRRGHCYATILIDLDTHRPIEVMDGRGAEALTDWLTAHPGVQVVCRDRSGAFAEGIRVGAPDAQQCADRWHLYQNLCEAVDKTIRAHHADLREPTSDSDEPGSVPPVIEVKETPIMDRTRRRHAEIHGLLAQGHNQTQICQILGLSFGTVQKSGALPPPTNCCSAAKTSPATSRASSPTCANGSWRKAATTPPCSAASSTRRDIAAVSAPSAATSHPCGPGWSPLTCRPSRRPSATSGAGSPAPPTTSPTPTRPGSTRSPHASPTWTASPATSPRSPRCSSTAPAPRTWKAG